MSFWPYSFMIKITKLTKVNYRPISVPPVWSTCFFISIWKFGTRLGYVYYKNILKLNLCFRYAYINLNLKYDIKDSYSGILCYFNTFSFSFFSMKTLFIIENTILQQEKKPVSNNYFTFFLISGFSWTYRPFRSHIWMTELH